MTQSMPMTVKATPVLPSTLWLWRLRQAPGVLLSLSTRAHKRQPSSPVWRSNKHWARILLAAAAGTARALLRWESNNRTAGTNTHSACSSHTAPNNGAVCKNTTPRMDDRNRGMLIVPTWCQPTTHDAGEQQCRTIQATCVQKHCTVSSTAFLNSSSDRHALGVGQPVRDAGSTPAQGSLLVLHCWHLCWLMLNPRTHLPSETYQ